MKRALLVLTTLAAVAGVADAREMTSAYVITAAAHTPGLGGTYWYTDLTLVNPHTFSLPVVLQFLPSNQDNSGGAPAADITLNPLQTLNLWDVLGSYGFDGYGHTGALLVYTNYDPSQGGIACPDQSAPLDQRYICDFAAFARTYTPSTSGGNGEYGQGVPGFPTGLGVDGTVLAYLPQIMVDDSFRTNLGVASGTNDFVTVRFDLQDTDGNIIDTQDQIVPPYGHAQWGLHTGVTGGTVVAYVVSGPSGSLVYPYASVVNWDTGDAVNVEAQISPVGFQGGPMAAQAMAAPTRGTARFTPPARLPAPHFSLERLTMPRR